MRTTASTTINLLITAAVCLILGSAHLLDAPTESQQLADAAKASDDARHAAMQAQRTEQAAHQICWQAHGPSVQVVWDAQERLSCQPKRGQP